MCIIVWSILTTKRYTQYFHMDIADIIDEYSDILESKTIIYDGTNKMRFLKELFHKVGIMENYLAALFIHSFSINNLFLFSFHITAHC